MTISHHASDELLLTYAAGKLSPAPALVVESHVALSEDSRGRLGVYEALGGAVLADSPLEDVSENLFERTLALIHAPEEKPAPAAPIHIDNRHVGIALPAPLARRKIGRWRWMGPGMHYARVEMPEDPGINLVLLKIASGRSLPMHGHSGTELTLVLKGAYRDESGRFGPGDIAEEDEDSDHSPVVEAGEECICLASIEGPMRPHGWIGRVVQPFIGL